MSRYDHAVFDFEDYEMDRAPGRHRRRFESAAARDTLFRGLLLGLFLEKKIHDISIDSMIGALRLLCILIRCTYKVDWLRKVVAPMAYATAMY